MQAKFESLSRHANSLRGRLPKDDKVKTKKRKGKERKRQTEQKVRWDSSFSFGTPLFWSFITIIIIIINVLHHHHDLHQVTLSKGLKPFEASNGSLLGPRGSLTVCGVNNAAEREKKKAFKRVFTSSDFNAGVIESLVWLIDTMKTNNTHIHCITVLRSWQMPFFSWRATTRGGENSTSLERSVSPPSKIINHLDDKTWKMFEAFESTINSSNKMD